MAYEEGTFASRPAAAGRLGYVYFATDTGNLYRSNNSSWTLIGSTAGGGGGPPTGAAGGVLDGTYPNPGIAAAVAGAGLAEASDVLSVNVDASTIEIATDTLQVKAGGIDTTQLANAGPGATGPIGSTTDAPVITIDAKGRVTALTSATIAGSGGPTDWKQTILPRMNAPSVVTQGTWVGFNGNTEATVLAISAGGIGLTNTSVAQNDRLGWKYPVSAGTYTLTAYVRKSTNTGIIDFLIDGSSVGTQDTYAAVAVGAALSVTGVSITPSAVHQFDLKMGTKNASSSGYVLALLGFDITRTA